MNHILRFCVMATLVLIPNSNAFCDVMTVLEMSDDQKRQAKHDCRVEMTRALILQLCDDDLPIRERATRRLVALGKAILPLIDHALQDDPNEETRWRLHRIRRRFIRMQLIPWIDSDEQTLQLLHAFWNDNEDDRLLVTKRLEWSDPIIRYRNRYQYKRGPSGSWVDRWVTRYRSQFPDDPIRSSISLWPEDDDQRLRWVQLAADKYPFIGFQK